MICQIRGELVDTWRELSWKENGVCAIMQVVQKGLHYAAAFWSMRMRLTDWCSEICSMRVWGAPPLLRPTRTCMLELAPLTTMVCKYACRHGGLTARDVFHLQRHCLVAGEGAKAAHRRKDAALGRREQHQDTCHHSDGLPWKWQNDAGQR